ncbi:hypothetical protein BD414DRAFT_479298 [Trametes punicea]|nr:hypothetical protein BD414DRAFT_479298 [Trametes punicea]
MRASERGRREMWTTHHHPHHTKNSPAPTVPISPSAMTVMTVTAAVPSTFNPAATRPRVSSPLAASAQPRPAASRMHAFPTSRPLRPFPSLSVSNSASATRKPIKIIEPPANFKGAFVLNLTQAELSRQD